MWAIIDGELVKFPSRMAATHATGIAVDMRVLNEIRRVGFYTAYRGKHAGATLMDDPRFAAVILGGAQ